MIFINKYFGGLRRWAKACLLSFRNLLDIHFEAMPLMLMAANAIGYIFYYFKYLLPYDELIKKGYTHSELYCNPQLIASNTTYLILTLGEHYFTACGVLILAFFAKSHNFRLLAKLSMISLSLLWIGQLFYRLDLVDTYFYNYIYMSVILSIYYIIVLCILAKKII